MELPVWEAQRPTSEDVRTVVNKKRTCAQLASLLSLLLVLMAVPRPASAYVDPGSGAMLWQVAAAAVIGSLFYVKRAIAWIKERFGLRSDGR
jgi:hypothetical protein